MIGIVETLAGQSAWGMSNKALAHELKTPDASICRDLKILEEYGWVEKSGPSGRWRMSPRFGKLAGTIMKCFREAKLNLTGDEARYASEMQ